MSISLCSRCVKKFLMPSLMLAVLLSIQSDRVFSDYVPSLHNIKPGKHDDFIDPNDMFNYQPIRRQDTKQKDDDKNKEVASKSTPIVSGEMEDSKQNLEPVSSEKENSCVQQTLVSDRPFYKQHIRSLLTHMQVEPAEINDEISYEFILTLSKSDFNTLRKFIETESASIQDVNSVLGQIIRKSTVLQEVYVEKWEFEDIFFGIQFKIVKEVIIIILLVLAAILLGSKINMSWQRLFVQIVSVCFIISIPWNWFHMYKVAVAKRHSEVVTGIPEECRPEDVSWQKSIKNYLDSMFTVSHGSCAQYHEKLMVDPFWEVSPPQAVAVTITKFILEPVTHVGEAISKFFRSILLHVPVVMYPVVITCTLISIFFILILFFGYRITLPFFLGSIEPSRQSDAHLMKAVKGLPNSIQEIQAELKFIKDKGIQESQERHLEHRTHLAIKNSENNFDRNRIENIGPETSELLNELKATLKAVKQLGKVNDHETKQNASSDTTTTTDHRDKLVQSGFNSFKMAAHTSEHENVSVNDIPVRSNPVHYELKSSENSVSKIIGAGDNLL